MPLVDDCIRMDLLYRLRWNLLADLHDVEIVWGSRNEEEIGPFFEHASADADFGLPSLSRLEVKSRECDEKFRLSYDSDPTESSYQPPPPLIIQNEDGASITFRQFVTEVHAYLNEHFEEVKKAQRVVAAEPWSETLLYFRRAWPYETEDGNVVVYVEMMPRAADAKFRDILWGQQLNKAHEYERKIQGRRFRLVKPK
ncbi:hypothetical protein GGP41_004175 [Bipolaris sorokiniana]|uniref:Uncharacterized protein n=2 Tax=Cochliobolus sativus TaxID=45130 RepID=A0A8H6DWU4_COCSA|nr:uncharacterized protein COCSADRAFT_344427 [Bipolaris sorokiniana ND90Pr]EMD61574.1 hypothetical protein COCSADRAFT_344427 [Bipolaris sorokiniana ND90Pr]KAF5851386.1 hypothetical protein GGP41_004175 [Bipolaris sorokiniana]